MNHPRIQVDPTRSVLGITRWKAATGNRAMTQQMGRKAE